MSYFDKTSLYRILSSSTLVIAMFLSSQYREDICHMGGLSPAFRKQRGRQNTRFYLYLLFFKCP